MAFFLFCSLASSKYLSVFSLSLIFTLLSAGTAKSSIQQEFFCLLIITWSGLLTRCRWSVYISKSCVSFSRTDSGLCIYHLEVWWNFNFLHNSQWITFLTQSGLVWYSFCTSLPHLLMCLIISSLSPHNLLLLFSCILSIFALTLLVLWRCFILQFEEIYFLS